MFDWLFGPPVYGSLTAPMTEEQRKLQNAAQQNALQQFDPAGALLLQNLQVLTAMRPYLTTEEHDQINALTRNVVARLGVQQALPPQRNPEV